MKHASTILIDSRRSLKFTESPRWRDGRLWFLDIHDRRIKTADLDKRLETAVELPSRRTASEFGATAAFWSATPFSGGSTAGMGRPCSPSPTSTASRASA
jgi:hypothetical protein